LRPGGEPIVAKRPPLAVSLLDAFSAAHDGQPLAIKNKKAQAVVAYLLLAPGRRETRERLCGLLWSESSEEKARGSLRQALHQLRELFESIGFAGLVVGRDDISLRASLFSVDVWAIEESAAETGDVHPLLLDRKRLPETLLCGLEELDPSFRLWLLVQRQALHERLARRLERALDAAGREPSTQVDLATALLNLDPTHEGACRILMEDHAAHGDTAGALRVYKALWDLLDEEYDSEPSDQTKDLVVRIKTGEFKGRAPAESAKRAESAFPAPSPGPSAPLSKALALGNVLPSEPAVPAHNLLTVSEFDSRGVGGGVRLPRARPAPRADLEARSLSRLVGDGRQPLGGGAQIDSVLGAGAIAKVHSYARVQGTTREEYAAFVQRPVASFAGLKWRAEVRAAYQAAWSSDRNSLLSAWARANRSLIDHKLAPAARFDAYCKSVAASWASWAIAGE
jgi:DNA-binding SARP family transcriptional activator